MQGQIEALALAVGVDPQTHDQIEKLEEDEGRDARPTDGPQHALDLDPDLRRIAVDQAACSVAAHRADRKHAGKERAHDAPDAMDAEDVERVVIATAFLR